MFWCSSQRTFSSLWERWLIRRNVISDANPYLFTSTQNWERHLSGWHSPTNVCKKLPIKEKWRITGTGLSTLMTAINLTDGERELVYKYLGQTSATGKHLLKIDTSM